MPQPQVTSQPQRFFVPEVVQTSAMDCGPAALKALLAGFNIGVSYGRLREACQTSVDGTSIDTLEVVAQQLGLDAQQIMAPADFLFLAEAHLLRALAVVRLPNGALHFVVIWRISGPLIQVMNPATGRQWLRRETLLADLYRHTYPVTRTAWRAWAGGDGFRVPLAARLQQIGMPPEQRTRLLTATQATDDWRPLATLDAATRLAESLVRANALDRGVEAANLIEQLLANVTAAPAEALQLIPSTDWAVTPDPQNADQLLMHGAVLLVIRGVRATSAAERAALAPEMAAALTEKEVQPFWTLWRLLRQDGLLAPVLLAVATLLAALGTTLEALILRGLLQAGEQLLGIEVRTTALVVILLFGALLLLLEFTQADTLARLGRHLDLRLRIAFLTKIPRLSDRYFQSRLVSDMTMRAHELAAVKEFPALAVQFLQVTVQAALTTAGVIYFVPTMAGVALFVLALALLPAFLARPILQEQDMRYRTHSSGLSRFYLDGLLGLIPLRTHSAEQSFQNAHELLLTEWFQAGRNLYTFNLWVRGAQAFLSTGSVIWILTTYLRQGGDPDNVLLLFYWALNLPVLG